MLANASRHWGKEVARLSLASTGSAAAVRNMFKSASAETFQKSSANKVGLSYALDGTLRDGSHNMRIFGLGYLRSVASPQAHAHFTTSMYFWYQAMEEEFDAAVRRHEMSEATTAATATTTGTAGGDGEGEGRSTAGADAAMARVWQTYSELRRTPALERDLAEMGLKPEGLAPSPATAAYVEGIRRAGGAAPELLLAHFYCRYFADLFGGSALGYPTRVALGKADRPAFYVFPAKVEAHRRAYIEGVYEKLNEVGAGLSKDMEAQVVEEAKSAFRHNAAVYSEACPAVLPSMNVGAAMGAVRIATGAVKDALASPFRAR